MLLPVSGCTGWGDGMSTILGGFVALGGDPFGYGAFLGGGADGVSSPGVGLDFGAEGDLWYGLGLLLWW